jgi:uncharacterized protein YndB with AHSA1/START domain
MASSSKPFTLSRDFDTPRELLFKCWTDPVHLYRWFCPKGSTMSICDMDLRPGGTFFYGMRTPDGYERWGKWQIEEVRPPERLVVIVSFSDAERGVTRHPFSPKWPLETLSTTTLTESPDGVTTMTLEWSPYNAQPDEIAAFDAAHEGMRQGWSGTLDALSAYLADISKN